MNCSLPGFSVHGISKIRTLEWVDIFFSRKSSRPRDQTHISYIGKHVLYHWATRVTLNEAYCLQTRDGRHRKDSYSGDPQGSFDYTFPSNSQKYSSLVSSSTWLNLLIKGGNFFFFIVFVGIVLHYISNRMFLVKVFLYVKTLLPNQTCICSPAI